MARVLKELLLIILMLSFINVFVPKGHAAQTQSLTDGNTAFALELFSQIKSTPGNVFFSPYSISTCLAMVYAGAHGDTEEQLARVLHFQGNQAQIHSSFAGLQNQLNEASKQNRIELKIANAHWTQKGYPFLPAFLEIAKGEYQANVNQADFNTDGERARIEINQWVAESTKDKIQNLLPPGSLHSLTRMIVANAIYFKGLWTKPFDKAKTSNQPFYLPSGDQVAIPLMHHIDNVRYTENGEFQAVELSYKSDELSMVGLLPREKDGCAKLESRLTPALLSQALSQMKQQRVEIFLPRFKLESNLNLNDTLVRMGMTDAFGSKADFSAMDGSRLLYISGVFHKAWGEVNEEGTEAAAATAVAVAGRAISQPPPPPPIFRADHPFIFFIRDIRSGSLLFLGRFATPTHNH